MKIRKWMFIASCSLVSYTLQAQDSGDATADRGKNLYDQTCLACHQIDGSGVPSITPPLIEGVFVNGDKSKLIGVVLSGMQDVEIKGEYYAGIMPAFDYLSDEVIADILTFVRSNFKNNADAVSAAEVAKVRAAKK